MADTLGRPLRLALTAGQAAEIKSAAPLLEGVVVAALIADKGYDSDALRVLLASAGTEAVIPSTRSRKAPIPRDALLYRLRNRIERCL